MKFFMDSTFAPLLLLGRKNYESFPLKYRPLKNRTNIIITRNRAYQADGCLIVNSIEESLTCMNFSEDEEIFVIGGGEIYKKFLESNLIDKMYITHIDDEFEGDTYFPELNFKNWSSNEIMVHKKDLNNPYDFKIICYKNKIKQL
jgi:Dihydrofolate reductase